VLDEFRFTQDGAIERLERGALSFGVLVIWLLVTIGIVFLAARRVRV